jgi:UTP:GlnB (protein PII) uridylyltransferase
MANARVRFVESGRSILSRLEIEAVDRPELVSSLTEALFNLRIQIVRFETRVAGASVRAELFVVEFDGAAIGVGRRAEIQLIVLEVVERCATSPRPEVRRSESPSRKADRFTAPSSERHPSRALTG